MTRDYFTIFRSAKLPWQETDISRRYLHILHKWTPTAIATFSDWPMRINCGHFYGGCNWYGEETCSPAFVFALIASSPEYDPVLTGCTRHDLRMMAYKALRYLCFTHDTGPADCVRPAKALGRSDCCSTKWGERGKGFFPESQCGVTLGQMAITALLLNDLLDDETWSMLDAIYTDYAERFATMEPRSGVYLDTQMEENAWTSLGLASTALILGHHPLAESWLASARRWMFLTVASPQDARNRAQWQGGKNVSDLVFKTFTSLPDYMAENHGMVHPTYTAASMTFLLNLAVLFDIYGMPLPAEALYNRDKIYGVLKSLSDRTGLMHPVQGMDWPYLRTSEATLPHTAAALLLHDVDAARLELLVLERAEQIMESNEGRMYHRDVGEKVNNIQEPLIMWEYQASHFAYAYTAHRQLDPGLKPATTQEIEVEQRGVRVFPHSGFIFHRHPHGQTSFSWRNNIMALPLNKDGLLTVAPATNSILAQFGVKDNPDSQHLLSLAYDEQQDCFALNMVMDRCQDSVRQRVLYASLPNGTSLLLERLEARKDISITYVKQGFLRIINEHFQAMPDNCHGQRTLFSKLGEKVFHGYVSTDPQSDIQWQASNLGWLNIDDRLGIVYMAEGSTTYLNRHYYNPWWAVADDLILSQRLEPKSYLAGECVAEMAVLVSPDQLHEQTAAQEWRVLRDKQNDAVGILADDYLAVANWSANEAIAEFSIPYQAQQKAAIPVGKTRITEDQIIYQVPIKGAGARLQRLTAYLMVSGTVEIMAEEQGTIWVRNTGSDQAVVTSDRYTQPRTLEAGEFLVI
ncbi:MAG: hypothetical protein ACYCZF_07640 [Anaerolineae bacterium]